MCGTKDCEGLGCERGDCGSDSCDGGCGIWGCFGLCGPFGCGSNCDVLGCDPCALEECGGLGCTDGSCDGGEEDNNGGEGDDDDDSCTKSSTITNFYVSCTSIDETSTSCSTTSSSLSVGCGIDGTTTTTGAGSCPTPSFEDDQGDEGGTSSIVFSGIPTSNAQSLSTATDSSSSGDAAQTAIACATQYESAYVSVSDAETDIDTYCEDNTDLPDTTGPLEYLNKHGAGIIHLTIATTGEDGCASIAGPQDLDECKSGLYTALNGCETDTQTEKSGATVTTSCRIFKMWVDNDDEDDASKNN